MSRTYRRKNENYPWMWYGNEEEFNEARDSIISYDEIAERQKKLISLYPENLPPYRWDRDNTLEVTAARIKLLKPYNDYRQSYEYCEAKWTNYFHNQSGGAKTYREYVKKENARYHSDAGVGRNSSPGWFNNLYFERPMRRNVKRAIKHALKYDELDQLLCDERLNGGAWLYW